MLRPISLRVLSFSLVSAVVLGACAGDPATAPGGPDYIAAAKPLPGGGISLSNLVVTPTTLSISTVNAGSYTVTITNSKGKLAYAGLQGYVQQVDASTNALDVQGVGGTELRCVADSPALPHGTCQYGFSINFGSSPSVEPGPATFHLELFNLDGAVLATADAAITLTN